MNIEKYIKTRIADLTLIKKSTCNGSTEADASARINELDSLLQEIRKQPQKRMTENDYDDLMGSNAC